MYKIAMYYFSFILVLKYPWYHKKNESNETGLIRKHKLGVEIKNENIQNNTKMVQSKMYWLRARIIAK